ncbi:hypothetical protein HJC23_011565 [Cyclotella cryptica]|uniref:Uncharacterized protein n=1 Tax=Cyclotella cryptica TaxID=29204 RepID=A0ABD3P1T2_9STRA
MQNSKDFKKQVFYTRQSDMLHAPFLTSFSLWEGNVNGVDRGHMGPFLKNTKSMVVDKAYSI